MSDTDKSIHLSPDDLAVWREFLATNPCAFRVQAYQVKVGGPTLEQLALQAADGAAWRYLMMKRIDVVAHMRHRLCVIEVKPYGNLAAMGQALGYAWLYNKEMKPKEPVAPWVVCGRLEPDVIPIYADVGVGLWCASKAEPEAAQAETNR